MTRFALSRRTAPLPCRAVAAALTLTLVAGSALPVRRAGGQPFRLTLQGVLDVRSSLGLTGALTPLGGPQPFTLTAAFDPRSGNLAAPVGVPGFVAYTPSSILLTLGGRTYSMQPFTAANPTGVAVAIFDQTTPFGPPVGPPGRYGVGIIQNPLADGSGIIADYLGATNPFTIAGTGLLSTTFTGYAGVGVTSGVCTVGTPANCSAHAVTPIPLTFGGQGYALALGNYEDDAPATPTFAAVITAVPEPQSLALAAAGLVGVAGAAAGRRRVRR